MYYVYVIKSLRRSFIYVGLTNNLHRRIKQHQSGKGRSTSPYAPFTILQTETFLTRIQARQREKYLKSGSGKEWLKAKFHDKIKS